MVFISQGGWSGNFAQMIIYFKTGILIDPGDWSSTHLKFMARVGSGRIVEVLAVTTDLNITGRYIWMLTNAF